AGGGDAEGRGGGGAGRAGRAGGGETETERETGTSWRSEQIVRAAEIARLDKDVVDFPRGYDTVVGERGITLSGGQKQRLALARALIADQPILVLDDALSSVDTQTERAILHALRETTRGKTVMVISHRLSAVRDADLIV